MRTPVERAPSCLRQVHKDSGFNCEIAGIKKKFSEQSSYTDNSPHGRPTCGAEAVVFSSSVTAPQCALQVMRLQTGNRVNNRSSNRKCGAYFSRVLGSPITCRVSIQHLKILNSCIRKCSWTVKIWLNLKELYCKNCEPVSGVFFCQQTMNVIMRGWLALSKPWTNKTFVSSSCNLPADKDQKKLAVEN